ncbi:hypothetical protein [Geobacillus jurassicus]|jgi:hypothetical protein|uniref:Type II CBASS E2 protein domain-containing protein n=1 Tax=Geobacillus jurassicus TaxID=235932 RepID=A0ABV6GVW1_9BACL|nr:hypothetical protein [Geobacillus jurassicus]
MRNFKRKQLTIAQQRCKIQQFFPSFRYFKKGYWIGTLRPTLSSPFYTIKIIYGKYNPKVFVIKPTIHKEAPHRYSDGSLCLYYPGDRSYHESLFIADTIIPWTAEWLYYYEKWLEDGIWWGPEAPHSYKLKKQ